MNLNSLNGGGAPAPPAPKRGPPIAVIVIVILVIIGIVVGIVMATRPAPKAAALPSTVPPPPATVTPPPPAAVTPPKAVTPPPPPVGREVAGSSVAMTPDQMLAAKQAQADMRYAEPKLTSEQLAQAQRDAGKKVEVTKTAEGIAAVDKMKKAESPPPPPAAYNVKQNAIAYLADPARTSKMIGTAGGSLDVCKASCDGKPECTHFDRVGNSCTLYKGAEWVGSYPGGQSYCKSQCQT